MPLISKITVQVISTYTFISLDFLDDIALFNERIKANIQLDMQNKAREDPLFAIR